MRKNIPRLLNLDTYKPPMPYPQALNRPRAKVNKLDDDLLEAFQKMTITIPLIDAIKHIPSFVNSLKAYAYPIGAPKGLN